MKFIYKSIVICLLSFVIQVNIYSQNHPMGIPLQGIITTDAEFLQNGSVDLTIGIIAQESNGSTELIYEETQNVSTNSFGLYTAIIGQGNNTNNGTLNNFSDINWASAKMEITVEIDSEEGNVSFENQELWAVPYAIQSLNTGSISTFDLSNTNLTNLNNFDILQWNDNNWEAIQLIDTAAFAQYSMNSNIADTATVAWSTTENIVLDSANYAYTTNNANLAINVNNTIYADTATFVNSAIVIDSMDLLLTHGNDSNGSDLSVDAINTGQEIRFKTNNEKRAALETNGDFTIKSLNPSSADLHVDGNLLATRPAFVCDSIPDYCEENLNNLDEEQLAFCDSLALECLVQSQQNNSIISTDTANVFFYNPQKSALRAGRFSDIELRDTSMGIYSFAGGYNSHAGNRSFAWGKNANAIGRGALVLGDSCSYDTDEVWTYNSGAAIGYQCHSSGWRSIAMGYQSIATPDCCTFAAGFQTEVSAFTSVSLGYRNKVEVGFSIGMGSYTRPTQGSFLWADRSVDALTYGTGTGRQFMIKASGGTILYSSIDENSGVELVTGSGAWASISDRNKKENFIALDYEDVLQKIQQLDIYTWNYKKQLDIVRHLGPTAQDFKSSFGLGISNKLITTTDTDGVALAGIKGLINRMDQIQRRLLPVEELSSSIENTKIDFKNTDKKLDELEARVQKLINN